jgi:GH15 family glucan-1,4-alpha-glucosidase
VFHFGLVGNCQISAHIQEDGSVDWLCLPQPDSEPVFGRLLDPNGGHFKISLADTSANVKRRQYYVENTNVIVTESTLENGEGIRVTDFCPRFEQHGRMFRPISLFRKVEPINGSPSIRVECVPVQGWSKLCAGPNRGNSHLRFEIRGSLMRLTTNMPLTYLTERSAFHVTEPIYFGLTWDWAIEEDLAQLSERFLAQTIDYWRMWVKHCSIPSLFQAETIRSALTLKMHCYEDTGAILAALTTSLPEEVGHTRNWDYRYCWLRDAYFSLSAFHNLGHFEEMEGFLKFLLNLAHQNESAKERLAPVYTLGQGLPLPETIQSNWVGFKDSGPVRSFNQAAEHVQNDVYGEMILTLSPIFFDERFRHLRTKDHEELLAHLATLCARTISVPDAGLWEVRDGWQEHSFANLMAWAGLERVARIRQKGYLQGLAMDLPSEVLRAQRAVEKGIKDGSLRNGPTDDTYDCSLALMPVLRFPNQEVSNRTVDNIMQRLAMDPKDPSFFYRYLRTDDFGRPQSAFMICSFWVSQALSRLGRLEEGRLVLEGATRAANSLGLYSEHYDPRTQEQLGNFPQAYSHVGLINAAFACSPPWNEVL